MLLAFNAKIKDLKNDLSGKLEKSLTKSQLNMNLTLKMLRKYLFLFRTNDSQLLNARRKSSCLSY